MAVNFSGINQVPQTRVQPQRKVAFTAAQKADTVSFGNANALMKVAEAEPTKKGIKKVLDLIVKNLGKIKDFVMGLLKLVAKPFQAILGRLKGKGGEVAKEVAQKAAGG